MMIQAHLSFLTEFHIIRTLNLKGPKDYFDVPDFSIRSNFPSFRLT
jgi:hypothetical protein